MGTVKTMTIPEAGAHYYGLGRGGSYNAAKRGDLALIGKGKHKRVSVPAMERMLEEAGQERPKRSGASLKEHTA
jgi:hypothetical protein